MIEQKNDHHDQEHGKYESKVDLTEQDDLILRRPLVHHRIHDHGEDKSAKLHPYSTPVVDCSLVGPYQTHPQETQEVHHQEEHHHDIGFTSHGTDEDAEEGTLPEPHHVMEAGQRLLYVDVLHEVVDHPVTRYVIELTPLIIVPITPDPCILDASRILQIIAVEGHPRIPAHYDHQCEEEVHGYEGCKELPPRVIDHPVEVDPACQEHLLKGQ